MTDAVDLDVFGHDPLRRRVLLWAHEGCDEELRQFQTKALGYLNESGGRLVSREHVARQNRDDPSEIQLLEFQSELALNQYQGIVFALAKADNLDHLLAKQASLPIVEVSATRPPSSTLSRRFMKVASQHAREVITLLENSPTEFERLRAAEHAGACVELLAKGFITMEHPASVLVDDRSGKAVKSAIRRSGGNPADADLRKAVTIGAHEATSYLADLRNVDDIKGASAVLAARNAAVHSAVPPDVDQLGWNFGYFLRSVFPQRDDHIEFLGLKAHSVFDKQYGEIKASLLNKLNEARDKYAQLIEGKSPTEQEKLIAAKQNRARSDEPHDHEDPVTCPACRNEAVYHYDVVGIEWESDGIDVASSAVWESSLECAVCELALTQPELSNLDTELEFSDGSLWADVVEEL